MLEWLKTILGDSYTDDIDKKVSDELGKNFNLRADFNAKNDALKAANDQLTAANKQIEDLKSLDAEGVKKAADEWKAKYETQQTEYAAKLAKIELEKVVDSTIADIQFSSASAKKAYRAELLSKDLKVDNGALIGHSDILKAYKTSDPDAFKPETDPAGAQTKKPTSPPQIITGASSSGKGPTGADAANTARAAMGLPPLK
jgi:predicted phage tail protein